MFLADRSDMKAHGSKGFQFVRGMATKLLAMTPFGVVEFFDRLWVLLKRSGVGRAAVIPGSDDRRATSLL